MKNRLSLENYGVVPLTTREMKTTNGGGPFAFLIGAALGCWLASLIWPK